MADNYQTGGVHPPKDHGVDGQVSGLPLNGGGAAMGTGSSPNDDKSVSNAK